MAMAAELPTRKRPAPGTSPLAQQPPSQVVNGLDYPPVPDTTSAATDQYVDWTNASGMNNIASAYPDPSVYDPNMYSANLDSLLQQTSGPVMAPSNQLVRRNTNQQLAPRAQAGQQSVWPPPAATGTRSQQDWDDDDEELERQAQLAKRQAQADRKQIPPFVQKLSSFLDQSNNTDLIRWSDDGKSFIVLDEDEFARTLIPELFKHNNYASFVRQLNMYGFHKKVGLSDNSMRTAETKRKLPSEYYNKYFRRGKPDYLYLIAKPKSSTATSKRKRAGEKHGDSDDERKDGMDLQSGVRAVDGSGNLQDLQLVPKADWISLQQEVQALQRQQKYISTILGQIKQQNDQLYSQASAYQALHERHENSINAILRFLATFYNRTVEGRGGSSRPDISEIFTNAAPQSAQQHGTVFDMGDVDVDRPHPFQRTDRKPLLLPAPKVHNQMKGSASASASRGSTRSPPMLNQAQTSTLPNQAQPKTSVNPTTAPEEGFSHSPPLKTDVETPNILSNLPDNDEILSVINAANASSSATTPGLGNQDFDISTTLDQLDNANGNAPLTSQQRDDMLNVIAASSASAPSINANSNNALASPNPPPMPSLEEFSATQAQLDMVQKLQEEHASQVQSLADRLQPLSPTGSIPGLADNGYHESSGQLVGMGNPGDFDLDKFIHSADDYFTDANGANGGDIDFSDINFDFDTSANVDGANDGVGGSGFLGDSPQQDGGGRVVGSVSSDATSPTSTAGGEEVAKEEVGTPSKRRKIG